MFVVLATAAGVINLSVLGDPAGVGAALLIGLALLPRAAGRWWLPSVAVMLAAGWWGWPLLPLLMVTLFDLSSRRRAWWAAAIGVIAMLLNLLSPARVSLWQPQEYGAMLFLALAVVLGLWLGGRRRLVGALQDTVGMLQTERELREQQARDAERSLIAAEMHDVLAHRLSLIALHAGVLSAGPGPSAVTERAELLRATSAEALEDLREVLGALRSPSEESDRREPTLQALADLVDSARGAGQAVGLTTEGSESVASAGHRLAVIRLVQEGLTNARKHGRPDSPVDVRVRWADDLTEVSVSNHVASGPSTAARSGFGLVGLRERVATLGGTLTSARTGDVWRLHAVLPRDASPPSTRRGQR
ncbi:hypothetical protein GCM10027425_03700 [Alteromonas gracilis]